MKPSREGRRIKRTVPFCLAIDAGSLFERSQRLGSAIYSIRR